MSSPKYPMKRLSFDVNQDGGVFRQAAFTHLAEVYSSRVKEALTVLGSDELRKQYPIESLWNIHTAQLKPEYLFRHALPFLIVEDSFFKSKHDDAAPYLAALLLGYTLVLGQLDYFFDGNEPVAGRGNAPLKLSQADTAAFCTKSIYAAIGLLLERKNGEVVAREALVPFGNFVVSRLYQDYLEKFQTRFLQNPPTIDNYLNSPISSLRASSYWEVMLKGSFARHAEKPPIALIRACGQLRILRQLVDEIADLRDDVFEGSLTLPVLYALHDQKHQKRTRELIAQTWDTAGDLTSRKIAADHLHGILVESGIFDQVYAVAESAWNDGKLYCRSIENGKGDGFELLLDIKMAKLAAMAQGNWRDIHTKDYYETT